MKKILITFSIMFIAFITTMTILLTNDKLYAKVLLPYVKLNLVRYNSLENPRTINIVYVTDSHYVFPTSISMRSAIINKKNESKYHFFIVGIKLNDVEINKLSQMAKENVKVSILNQKDIFKWVKYKYRGKYIIGTSDRKVPLFNLSLPCIFPNFNKILFLDSDTVVNKDLGELYNTNISGKYAGVVGENRTKRAGEKLVYFNSGMMLLNLSKIREDKIVEKLYDFRFGNLKNSRLMVQDAFNTCFRGNVIYLSPEYNVQSANFIETRWLMVSDYYKIDTKKYKNGKDFMENSTIIHFILEKPWTNKNVYYAEYWYKYLTDEEKINLEKIMPKSEQRSVHKYKY